MTEEGTAPPICHRQALKMAVGAICLECGYDSVQKSALETLTEILQSYLSEIGRSTRQYCEVGGRSIPTLCDAQVALADVGFKFSSLPEYLRRQKRVTIGEPPKSTPTQNPNVLLVGERKNFPAYIPENSKYPKFPDPHTYVRTLTGQEPETKYSILRERGSSQRWDVERALTRFIAKTGNSHPLLPDDKNAFPLIAAVAPPITYQSALLPCENETVIRTRSAGVSQEGTSDSDAGRVEEVDAVKAQFQLTKGKDGQGSTAKSASPKKSRKKADDIDNPYLRPAKTPKLKKKQR